MTLTVEYQAMGPEEACTVLTDRTAYADPERLHRSLAVLRAQAPVHFVDGGEYGKFWLLTKHADICAVERNAKVFSNSPRVILRPADLEEADRNSAVAFRTVLHMDDPDHRIYRNITRDWFKPSALRKLEARLAELSRSFVDRMADIGGSCDFFTEVAAEFPVYVILDLLGLPESDYPLMMKLAQEFLHRDDPELARITKPEDTIAVMMEFFGYFSQVCEDRRANPVDDLATVIANAKIGDELISVLDVANYFFILATAGHDTTAASMAGGVQALVENPDEMLRLRDPALLESAVDEIVRWVTPITHFIRTATEPYELRGVRFEPGDSVVMSYTSANRDEDVFDDPFRFDVGRSPNPHLAFGFGPHRCLGEALAKMEIKALLQALLPRLESIELAGEPQLKHTTSLFGLKHLPISYRLRA